MWKPTPPPFKDFKKEVFQKAAKVSQFIYQIGESSILRQPSAAVPLETINSKDMQRKFAYLKGCLLDYRKLTGYGRGITAVQVGIPQRFSVILTPEKEIVFIINPVITKLSNKRLVFPEGCMSAAPVFAPIVRSAWVEFSYYDEKGNSHDWSAKDDTQAGRMMNRVFQHEIDHMEGIINLDKASSKEIFLESDPHFYDSAEFIKA